MPMSDSIQLGDDVVVHVSLSIDTPLARAEWSSDGCIRLSIGGLLLTLSPESALSVAASLATAASTATANTVLGLVKS